MGLLTERLIIAQAVTNGGFIAREVEHNCSAAPVLVGIRAVGDLTKEVKVCATKLNVDAAPIGRSHDTQLLRLVVEEFANAAQHIVGACHGKGELESVGMHAVIPRRKLIGVETTNKDIVVPAVNGPLLNGFLGGLLTEVRF